MGSHKKLLSKLTDLYGKRKLAEYNLQFYLKVHVTNVQKFWTTVVWLSPHFFSKKIVNFRQDRLQHSKRIHLGQWIYLQCNSRIPVGKSRWQWNILVSDRNQVSVSGTETKVQFWYVSVLDPKKKFMKLKLFLSQIFSNFLMFLCFLRNIGF